MKLPEHSAEAIEKHHAPDRKMYFSGADYAACERVHRKRIAFDRFKKSGTSNPQSERRI
jgi:hypothetical protein